MNNSFISVVGVIKTGQQLGLLATYLQEVHQVVSTSFSDYEIILVNSDRMIAPDAIIHDLPQSIKKDIFLLELSNKTSDNNAILAGLDRSNGDYTVIFDLELGLHAHLILDMFQKTRAHYDIVYLRSSAKSQQVKYPIFRSLFYWILRNYSTLKIDAKALDTRMISRRALNSLLRLRENLRYMKAIYSLVGYNTTSIEIDVPTPIKEYDTFKEKFRRSLVAITSYTSFLRSVLLWIFLLSLMFLALVVFNAIRVKVVGEDIFGNVGQAVPGWAFLVLFISVFFAVVCLNLYLMSIYLSNIYEEIKQRPLYIIESIKRF